MNPDTNKFEKLIEPKLLRPDGSPVPEHWAIFHEGEQVIVKNYTFKVGYIGESVLLLEPVGPVLVGEVNEKKSRQQVTSGSI